MVICNFFLMNADYFELHYVCYWKISLLLNIEILTSCKSIMRCCLDVVELRSAKNDIAKKISSNCELKKKNPSFCKKSIIDLGIYQPKKAYNTENHLRTLLRRLNRRTLLPEIFVETLIATMGILLCSKNSLFCILFCLLLLTNLSVGASQSSLLKLSKLKKGNSKNGSNSSSKTLDNISDLDTDLQLSSESLYLSLKTSKSSRPVKRQAHLPSSFSNSHKRAQRLITKFGFTVEIRRKGKVRGTRKRNAYSVLEFISIQTGVLAIRGKKSGRYLAMDRKGRLIGLKTYSPACNFHEIMVENRFFVFFQNIRVKTRGKRVFIRQMYVGFDKKGRAKKGKRVHRNDSAAHFQKMPVLPRKRKRPKTPKRRLKRPKSGKPKN